MPLHTYTLNLVIFKNLIIPNVGADVKQLKHPHTAVICIKVAELLWRTIWQFLINTYIIYN